MMVSSSASSNLRRGRATQHRGRAAPGAGLHDWTAAVAARHFGEGVERPLVRRSPHPCRAGSAPASSNPTHPRPAVAATATAAGSSQITVLHRGRTRRSVGTRRRSAPAAASRWVQARHDREAWGRSPREAKLRGGQTGSGAASAAQQALPASRLDTHAPSHLPVPENRVLDIDCHLCRVRTACLDQQYLVGNRIDDREHVKGMSLRIQLRRPVRGGSHRVAEHRHELAVELAVAGR